METSTLPKKVHFKLISQLQGVILEGKNSSQKEEKFEELSVVALSVIRHNGHQVVQVFVEVKRKVIHKHGLFDVQSVKHSEVLQVDSSIHHDAIGSVESD